ncbi:ABC-type nickel/cobalt efflux system, permease component RcnA [Micromonospora pallida]|uniref:ABC-type nickel/cobalt efflux system, permease component RcnA n=1 Tax=Micromonospora pallida TaxID=145854 RepID=A0A1C6SHR0_9ACTN|nr:hypothetical protein [Micromonospora pallida]SCL28779.1 ABC-type nickel/cobalt efflux system, permease component RcnA [Micromonospora pallida]
MNGLNGFDSKLVALFDNRAAFWVALVVALGVGAAHAVAPGHGKSVTAAYLVGTRGRYRDALRLGIIVAVMHTFSVLVLALSWVGLSGVASLGTETITGWMQAVAGLVVLGVGANLTYRQLRGRGHSHSHGHAHSHAHSNAHAHSHAPVPAHAHAHSVERAADGSDVHRESPSHGHYHEEHGHHHHHHEELTDPWSRRGLIALALSGGLLPSPSAFIVLVSGLLTGRALDAVVLVIAFGVGMALTLTGVGVVTIRGFALVATRTRRWPLASMLATWIPLLAGIAVMIGGCLYLLTALSALNA